MLHGAVHAMGRHSGRPKQPVADDPLQRSGPVHGSPSSHPVPIGAKPSPGHDALEPVHVSATSHCPADARHT